MDKDHTHNSGDVHIQNNPGRRTQESEKLTSYRCLYSQIPL
jgi:hypothetical protein